MQPLAATMEHDITRLHFCAAPHGQWSGIRSKRDKGQPRCELQLSYAWGIFLTPQHLQMVELGPGEARSELAAGQDDSLELRLAQARLVLVGLEERARAAARHLLSYKIGERECSLWLRVELPKQLDYADFVGSETNRSLWSRFLVRQTDRRSVAEGDSRRSDQYKLARSGPAAVQIYSGGRGMGPN
jgi:hypothetical protein